MIERNGKLLSNPTINNRKYVYITPKQFKKQLALFEKTDLSYFFYLFKEIFSKSLAGVGLSRRWRGALVPERLLFYLRMTS